MNENSKPTLQTWLKHTEATFKAQGIQSARLDAQLLAAHIIGKDRAWLLGHLDDTLTAPQLEELRGLANQRARRMPMAYLLGRQEFYGRNFFVTPDALIPRPETEVLVDLIKELAPQTVLDVGTGSGALAVTIAKELPHTTVEACDISSKALNIAKQNAAAHAGSVTFFTSNLLSAATKKYDCIVANLPYVDQAWERSPETHFEPALALFAPNGGLALIEKLIQNAPRNLTADGFLLLEADPRQHQNITTLATRHGFNSLKKQGFAIVFRKQDL